MKQKYFDLAMAILWSVIFVVDLIQLILGKFNPTWINVFFPTIILIESFWVKYSEESGD